MDFNNNPEYVSIIQWLQQEYPAAKDAQTADVFLTTNEITTAINAAFSTTFTNEDIHTLLMDQKYNTCSVGEMKQCWMLKKTTYA